MNNKEEKSFIPTKKSAFQRILVRLANSLINRPLKLIPFIPYNNYAVKGARIRRVEMPRVEPGRPGLRDRSSKPAIPTPSFILSIIIPVFNEEQTITKVLKKLLDVKLPSKKEIIIVDDGSTDGTKKKIEKWKMENGQLLLKIQKEKNQQLITHNPQLITVFHQKNQGKGAAIQSGIRKATGNYILIQDADMEYNPDEIPKLLSPILSQPTTHNPQPIAVYGSRFMRKDAVIPLAYYYGNKFLTILTNVLYGTTLTDMETGYKILPASFLMNIPLNRKRFDVEPEITAQLVRNHVPIVEVPITYRGRSHVSGKKLTARDAIGAIKTLIQLRFS